MYESASLQSEQQVLVQERMTDSMTSAIRLVKLASLCGILVVVLTLGTTAVVLTGEWRPDDDTEMIAQFFAVMFTVINYLFVFIYIFGALAVLYFLRYVYLDYLLRKYQPPRD